MYLSWIGTTRVDIAGYSAGSSSTSPSSSSESSLHTSCSNTSSTTSLDSSSSGLSAPLTTDVTLPITTETARDELVGDCAKTPVEDYYPFQDDEVDDHLLTEDSEVTSAPIASVGVDVNEDASQLSVAYCYGRSPSITTVVGAGENCQQSRLRHALNYRGHILRYVPSLTVFNFKSIDSTCIIILI